MDFGKLPIGFSMALAQNEAAMSKYAAMTEVEKQRVINQAHNARSESEMVRIVSGIVGNRQM